VVRELETHRLMESVERVPERQRRVLVRRYGLDGKEPATLADLSDELGVSRKRVRQLQREAECSEMRRRTSPWVPDRRLGLYDACTLCAAEMWPTGRPPIGS
jgi:hypothetical protein